MNKLKNKNNNNQKNAKKTPQKIVTRHTTGILPVHKTKNSVHDHTM